MGKKAHGPSGVLVVDKAAGMTSHDVVARGRRALQTRAVGHAGTLDPMATGVLVLASGQATRLLHYLVLDDKRYRATLKLGVATDSLDADGEVTASAPVPQDLTLAGVREVARGFIGPQAQVAPIISAIKRGGEPLYKRARRGETVTPPSRQVVVHALDVLAVEGDTVTFEVACGKGFYVRSLGRDLAAALGTVGHLTRLRRLQSGPFGLADAVPSQQLARAGEDEQIRDQLRSALLSPLEALRGMPKIRLDDTGVEHLRHGRPAPLHHLLDGPPHGPASTLPTSTPKEGAAPALTHAAQGPSAATAALSATGQLIAVVRREGDTYRVLRGFPDAPAAQ